MPRVDRECTTHCHACDCREEYFARIEKALKVARAALDEAHYLTCDDTDVTSLCFICKALAEIDGGGLK